MESTHSAINKIHKRGKIAQGEDGEERRNSVASELNFLFIETGSLFVHTRNVTFFRFIIPSADFSNSNPRRETQQLRPFPGTPTNKTGSLSSIIIICPSPTFSFKLNLNAGIKSK